MKKKLACLIAITIFSQQLFAQQQQDTVHFKRQENARITVTDRPPQAAFVELYGRSLIFSVNYDRRVFSRLNGLGYTIGVGYVTIDGVSLFSIPVTVNYLIGNNGKYFEVGGGVTYFNAGINDPNSVSASASTVIGTLTMGYRSQPVNGGFMFRAGLNPLFFDNNFIPYPYVSLGYNF